MSGVVRRGGPLLLSVALLLLVPACGGGGGGGGPTAPPPTGSSLTFTGTGSSSGAAVVLSRGNTGPDTLLLDVQAQSVNGLYGLYFDLAFPQSVLAYEGVTEGAFLAAGGASTSLQVAAQGGNLVVGLTRLGAVGGTSGSGTLLTLRFRAIASGTGSLQFSNNQGVAADGDPVADLDWLGGNVQATR